MALRAILAKKRESLRVYRQSALHEALAQELSDFWREACEHNVGPGSMRNAASSLTNDRLRAKLEDFADVFEGYRDWLEAQGLRDGDELLDLAADAALAGPLPEIDGLWLDGFAQMTPQERRLLNAVLRKCNSATLAFCLEERPLKPGSAFSMWSVVARTYCQLRDECETRPREECLPRRATSGRFDAAPALAHIDENWGSARAFEKTWDGKQVRIVQCRDLEGEAIFVAREIVKFVHAGGRFREAAVLVRSLDVADETLRRVFKRYGIPCFIDRRRPVAHHPLAELTRGAVRFIAYGFGQHDLFCALKSGLSGLLEGEVDWFENMALSRGWQGDDWRKPLFCGSKATDLDIQRATDIAARALGPILRLEKRLHGSPTGQEVAGALREFWETLGVEDQLQTWAEEAREALHTGVWTQMDEWLKTLELAFANERNSLTDWIAIIEAGLQSLTVGLIPPALDQTKIGAVDRSRNPDLRAVFLIGVNEGLFPKPAKERLLLNDSERETLSESGLHLGMTSAWNLGAEQFYGYIACTRARESLTITYSETGLDGEPLNPSLFITQLERLFPALERETFSDSNALDSVSKHELHPLIFSAVRRGDVLTPFEMELRTWPMLASIWERAHASAEAPLERLNATRVAALYGNRIRTSVSKLEQFAMCPFRFFVAAGLKAEERPVFELDKREEGSFQHEVLKEFHQRVEAMGKRWRDIAPAEGRALIGEIGKSLRTQFQDGLADATPSNRFKAESKLAALGEFIERYLNLLRECAFDPKKVEIAFGPKGPLPIWIVKIDETRALEFQGRIDRVDIWVDDAGRGHAVVYDYKSSKRTLDRKLVFASIQQQLTAYLAALQTMGGTEEFPYSLRPAGAFYVNLGMKVKSADSRRDALGAGGEDLRQNGVFDWGMIERFDPNKTGALFDYTVKGPTGKGPLRALPTEEFEQLLRDTEMRLRDLGRRIFDGELKMDPYAKGKERACKTCFYGGICRIDPWTHPFRNL